MSTVNQSTPIPVAIAGLGALGSLFVRAITGDPRVVLVGAVDIDPDKVGRSVADVTGEDLGHDIVVQPDLPSLLSSAAIKPAVLVHMTESRPDQIVDPLLEAIEAGINVVSAAESMFYPALRYPTHAARMHEAALKAGVTVTGTGINPGFSFDQLVLDLAAASTRITSLRLGRAVVVADTGPGDVEHVGFGVSEAEFRERIAAGTLEGHMGLPESFVQLSQRLDMPIDRIVESWEPVTSTNVTPSNIGDIPPGHVVGIVQHAFAYRGESLVMSARLAMYYSEGIEEPADEIELVGLHHVNMRIAPAAVSILGAAIVLSNVVALLPDAPAGLVSVLDLPTRAPRSGAVYGYDPASRPGTIILTSDTAVGLSQPVA